MMRVGDDRSRSRWLQVGVAGAALAVAFYAGRVTTPEKAAGAMAETRKVSDRSRERGAAGVIGGRDFMAVYDKEQMNPAHRSLAAMNAGQIAALARSLMTDGKAGESGTFSLAERAVWSRWAELDPEAALAAAEEMPGFSGRWQINTVYDVWAENDPAAAEAALARIQDPLRRAEVRTLVLRALAVRNPEAWMARLAADPTLARDGVAGIAEKWAEADPVGAFSRIAKLPAHLRLDAMQAVARNWASQDDAAAMAWAQSMPPGRERTTVLQSVFEMMVERDPETVLANLGPLSASERLNIQGKAFTALAEQNFEATFHRVSALPDAKERDELMKEILGYRVSLGGSMEKFQSLVLGLPAGEVRTVALAKLADMCGRLTPADSAELLQRCSVEDRQMIQRKMLDDLADVDPKAAAELLESLPGPDGGDDAVGIAAKLSLDDPAAALDFALRRQSLKDRKECVESVFEELMEGGSQGAIARLDGLPEGPLRQAALDVIAGEWAKGDPAAAFAWVGSLAEGEQGKALEKLVETVSENDPGTAAAFAADRLRNGEPGAAELATKLVDNWGDRDPAAAGVWLATLPDGDAKKAAVETLAFTWAGDDPEASGRWLAELPVGELRDAAASRMSLSIGDADPQLGLRWALQIGDEDERLSSAEMVFSDWKKIDPEAARTAIRMGGFSAEERERFLGALEQE